jgi:CubicO group peptidase (beta-lactamase class C family)
MNFPLASSTPSALGFDQVRIDQLGRMIEGHIRDGRYPGAQIAVARRGKLGLLKTFGDAALEPSRQPAADDTLWLLYSNTKVITACAVWLLVERGALRFTDTIAQHVPGFEANGKGEITLFQVLTHQGGFPNADVPKEVWEDHELLRRVVSNFTLEWTPGSRMVYHGRAAHWTAAVLVEALTKQDYRHFIRENIVEPLGLGGELFVGLPEVEGKRAADMHEPSADGTRMVKRAEENNAAFRGAGTPGGGGYATARAMAAFYQMLAAGGTLNGVRLLSPRLVQYVTRNHTGDMVDGYMGMPMHRGLGPHSRGTTPTIRGLGSLASPRTFGHGGVGSSYCWADPDSGVSFAYLTNSRLPDRRSICRRGRGNPPRVPLRSIGGFAAWPRSIHATRAACCWTGPIARPRVRTSAPWASPTRTSRAR